MKKKVVRLTESDLQRIVKRVIKEEMGGMDDYHPRFGNVRFNDLSRDEIMRMSGSDYEEDDFGFATHDGSFGGDDSDDEYDDLYISDDIPSYKTKWKQPEGMGKYEDRKRRQLPKVNPIPFNRTKTGDKPFRPLRGKR
jgi:hypothetical protein